MFGSTQGLGEVLQEQKCHFINKQVNKELYGSEVLKYVSGGSGSESTCSSRLHQMVSFSA